MSILPFHTRCDQGQVQLWDQIPVVEPAKRLSRRKVLRCHTQVRLVLELRPYWLETPTILCSGWLLPRALFPPYSPGPPRAPISESALGTQDTSYGYTPAILFSPLSIWISQGELATHLCACTSHWQGTPRFMFVHICELPDSLSLHLAILTSTG